MKRILIFSLSYYPFVGGAEVAVKEITDRISPEEIVFDMVTLRYADGLPAVEKLGNVTIHRIGFTKKFPSAEDMVSFPLQLNKYLYQVLAGLKARELHAKHPYDAIWTIMAHSAGIPAVIFKLRYPKIPYILTLQEGDPLDHIKRLALPVWPLFRRVFRTPTVVQAISQYLAQWAKDMGYRGDVQVIPNAVDASRFSRREYADAEDEKKLKAELGKETGDIYLAHTGRLIEKNGLEDLIGALEFLPGNVKLLLVGTGPQEDKLRRLAYNKNISDRVKFLGYVPIEEVAAYLKISDIFARPSLSEGMGNSFIEAMAVGLPVIATPVGGIVDFLFDPKANPDKAPTGLFCNVNDPQSIATQVTWLLDNPDLKEQIVSNAQSLVLRQYEWNNVVEDMKRKVFDVALKES